MGSGSGLFQDVTDCAGLDALHLLEGEPRPGWEYLTGQAFADVDGDSWLDVITTSPAGANTLHLGSPNGRFTAVPSGLEGVPALGALTADLNQDGTPELFLGRVGGNTLWEWRAGSFESILPAPVGDGATYGAAFADLDGNGTLELWTGNYICEHCTPSSPTCPNSADALWVSDGTSWVNRIEQAIASDTICGMTFQGIWSDLDLDGDLDLYVGNDKGGYEPTEPTDVTWRNTYFRNDGPGCGAACFTEVAEQNGSALRINSMGIDAGDYDNDGDLDLAVSGTNQMHLLRNDGGHFVEVTEAVGLAGDGWGVHRWGVLWVDIENDGDVDLFLASTGRDELFRNDDGVFVEVGLAELEVPDGDTRGAAAADYDRDGRMDLLIGEFGGRYRVLRNHAQTDHGWLGLRLVGAGAGGRDAVGARVHLTDDSGRQQMREVRLGCSHGAGCDPGLHFGLGSALPTRVEVVWPDGMVEVIDPPLGRWSLVVRTD